MPGDKLKSFAEQILAQAKKVGVTGDTHDSQAAEQRIAEAAQKRAENPINTNEFSRAATGFCDELTKRLEEIRVATDYAADEAAKTEALERANALVDELVGFAEKVGEVQSANIPQNVMSSMRQQFWARRKGNVLNVGSDELTDLREQLTTIDNAINFAIDQLDSLVPAKQKRKIAIVDKTQQEAVRQAALEQAAEAEANADLDALLAEYGGPQGDMQLGDERYSGQVDAITDAEIDKQAFDELDKMEKELQKGQNRRGRIGRGREQLTPEQLEEVRSQAESTTRRSLVIENPTAKSATPTTKKPDQKMDAKKSAWKKGTVSRK